MALSWLYHDPVYALPLQRGSCAISHVYSVNFLLSSSLLVDTSPPEPCATTPPFFVVGPLPARGHCITLPGFGNNSKPACANLNGCSGLKKMLLRYWPCSALLSHRSFSSSHFFVQTPSLAKDDNVQIVEMRLAGVLCYCSSLV